MTVINIDPLHFPSPLQSLLTTHLLQEVFPDHLPHHHVLQPTTHLRTIHTEVGCASSSSGIMPLLVPICY